MALSMDELRGPDATLEEKKAVPEAPASGAAPSAPNSAGTLREETARGDAGRPLLRTDGGTTAGMEAPAEQKPGGGSEGPHSREAANDAPAARPADEGNETSGGTDPDISDDGSPHGPLGFYDDDGSLGLVRPRGDGAPAAEPAAGNSEAAAERPEFAAFHSTPSLSSETAPEPSAGPARPDDDEDDDGAGAEDDVPMSLLGHLNEMRRRLFRIVIVAILGFIAFYGVSEPLYAWLSAPLKACLPEGSKLIYTSPQGAFFTYMKVALVASLFGTSPYSFYQVWAFIAPGLYKEEKRAVLPLAFFSSVFFLSGAAFCFYLVFPLAFQFFMGFATDTIVPMISVEEYLSFALKLILAFGLVFEMPLFSYFLSKFGVLSPEFMRKSRRYAVLVIFIAAAVLTPPDVFSQCMMAIPMLILYEASIYVSAAARAGSKKKPPSGTEKDGPQEEGND